MPRVVSILFFLFVHVSLVANSSCDDPKHKLVHDTLVYLNFGFLPESALQISSDYFDDPDYEEIEDCELQYKIRYETALAHQLIADYQKGLELFHELIFDSQKQGFHEIAAESYLTTALIHEFLGRLEDCKRNLAKAFAIITKYNVESVYPRYCVRFSSYSRFEKNHSAAKEFAEKAIASAKKIGDTNNELDGYLLLGGLVKDPNQAIANFERAVELFIQREGFIGASTQAINAAAILLRNGKVFESDIYLNRAYQYLNSAKEINIDYHRSLSYYYKFKKQVHKQRNRLDSALYYSEKYAETLPKVNTSTDHTLINQAETKFQVALEKQKSREIEARSQTFRNILYIGAFLFLLLCSLLYFLYLNKYKINQQNILISNQISELTREKDKSDLHLSEVHHRVKNNLQNIISLLIFKSNASDNLKEKDLIEEINGKIMSLYTIHDDLYQSGEFEVLHVKSYFENFLKPYQQVHDAINFTYNLDIDVNHLNIETMIPIGIITSELLTNASKFGRIEDASLHIDISMRHKDENEIIFTFQDSSKSYHEEILHGSNRQLGTSIIRSMSRQLRGKHELKNEGCAFFSLCFVEKQVSKV